MKKIVNQNTISLTEEYEIFVNDKLIYKVVSEPLKNSAKINFYESENMNQILKIAKKNFGVRANYLIENFRNNQIYFLKKLTI